MRENELLERAFAMPFTNPAYLPGPYRFVDREYLTITYRTDPTKLRPVVPSKRSARLLEAIATHPHLRADFQEGYYPIDLLCADRTAAPRSGKISKVTQIKSRQ